MRQVQLHRPVKVFVFHWLKSNSIMLLNTGSLVGTTAVTSLLGFVFWWLAARQLSPEVVGIASAAVSAMLLLGTMCMLGLGTLLITELPRQPGQEASLISTALVVVGIVGAVAGLCFALFAPFVSAQFNPLRATITDVLIFAAGISLTSVALVLDQALIGILRGSWQLGRNSLFAVIKLVLLFMVGIGFSQKVGMAIYAAWAGGIALSLIVLFAFVLRKKGAQTKIIAPQWGLLRKLGLPAIQHHFLNLILQAPTLALPVLVAVLLSSRVNAWFYVSWMIASFLFVVPNALTMVLHAMNSAQQSSLWQKARVTIGVSIVICLLANIVLQSTTKQVLELFGSSYADNATWCLRILALAAFPLIIKNHYISFCRIQDRIAKAMIGMLPGGVLELVAAVIGAHLGGLLGLSLGWVIAIAIESLFMLPTVYKTIRSGSHAVPTAVQQVQQVQKAVPIAVQEEVTI